MTVILNIILPYFLDHNMHQDFRGTWRGVLFMFEAEIHKHPTKWKCNTKFLLV